MELGDSLIVMGFINLIGFIIILQLRDSAWFKKENFKIQKSNIMAENKIKLKRLEKELGLTGKTPSKSYDMHETPSFLSQISSLAPLIKVFLENTDSEMLQNIVGALVNRGYAEEKDFSGNIIDGIMDFVNNNPDEAKAFIEGITGKFIQPQQSENAMMFER